MTLITFQDGKAVMRDGQVGTEQECCCGEASCDCPLTVQWGGNAAELTFTIGGNSCTLCMNADEIGSLSRQDGGGCYYWAEYDLSACFGSACLVRVVFELQNFPDCDCNGNGDYCDYIVAAWITVLGSCVVDDVTAGAFC